MPVTPDDVPRGVQEEFRIRGVFAVGDTGTLFLAEDMRAQRSGLLKVLRVRPEASRATRERLSAELRSQVSLHAPPSLGTPRREGVEAGVPWLFRDWVDGESLKSRLAHGGELAMAEALVVTAQVAAALDALHRKGLAHRAVRPGHILLHADAGGTTRAVLIDAGMAGRNDGDSAFEDLGDLFYLPPECSRGEKVSFRTDLYALGCVLYDALFGEPPFDGDEAEEVVYGHLYSPPRIPTDLLPGSVAELLAALLAKIPADRPMSAQQVLRDLEPFLPEDWREPAVRPAVVAPAPAPAARPRAAVSRTSSVPPPVVSLSAMRPSRPPPPPLPPRPEERLPPPAAMPSVIVEPTTQTPYGRAWEVAGSTDLSSIAPTEVLHVTGPKRGRLPTLTVGFLVGCLATAGGTWGLARSGNFQVVTDTLTTHLAVPPSMLAPAGTAQTGFAAQPSATTTPSPSAAAADEGADAVSPEGSEGSTTVAAEGALALTAEEAEGPVGAVDTELPPESGAVPQAPAAEEVTTVAGDTDTDEEASPAGRVEEEGSGSPNAETVAERAPQERPATRAERRRAQRAERRLALRAELRARSADRRARRQARIRERYRERSRAMRPSRAQGGQGREARTGLLL